MRTELKFTLFSSFGEHRGGERLGAGRRRYVDVGRLVVGQYRRVQRGRRVRGFFHHRGRLHLALTAHRDRPAKRTKFGIRRGRTDHARQGNAVTGKDVGGRVATRGHLLVEARDEIDVRLGQFQRRSKEIRRRHFGLEPRSIRHLGRPLVELVVGEDEIYRGGRDDQGEVHERQDATRLEVHHHVGADAHVGARGHRHRQVRRRRWIAIERQRVLGEAAGIGVRGRDDHAGDRQAQSDDGQRKGHDALLCHRSTLVSSFALSGR